MSTASTGRAREYRVRDHLIAAGYPAIMRAAASKGAADLLHGHPFLGAVLVQVGTANKTLNQEGRDRFCEAADLTGAMPVLCTVIEQARATNDLHLLARDPLRALYLEAVDTMSLNELDAILTNAHRGNRPTDEAAAAAFTRQHNDGTGWSSTCASSAFAAAACCARWRHE